VKPSDSLQDEMITCEELEQELSQALVHLYDPDYQPSGAFCELMGCDPSLGGTLAVQAAVIRAIKDLEPRPDIPPTAYPRRVHDLLHSRFVLKLTQDETALRLSVSLSSVQRMQREAIHALARTLWECQSAVETGEIASSSGTPVDTHEDASTALQAADWESQAKRELEVLQEKASDRIADVEQVLSDILALGSSLIAEPNVELVLEYVQPGLVALVHPSALRQMVIAAIHRLANHVHTGQIALYARLTDGSARITVVGPVSTDEGPSPADFTDGILVPNGTAVEASIEDEHTFLRITVPSLSQIAVLVIDDNPDMCHFYRRCTTGTSYRVTHTTSGQRALQRIKASPPDVIVLDVMLPDVDGWKLLMELHEDPTTRPIPVIVCSVIREEDLAYSLGAAAYLSKPVDPRRFRQVLRQVSPQALEGDQKAPVSSEAA
jgi:CheY-like chemotaxis protein